MTNLIWYIKNNISSWEEPVLTLCIRDGIVHIETKLPTTEAARLIIAEIKRQQMN